MILEQSSSVSSSSIAVGCWIVQRHGCAVLFGSGGGFGLMMMSGGVSFGESGSGGGNGCSMVAGGRSSLGWSTGGEGGVTIVGQYDLSTTALL